MTEPLLPLVAVLVLAIVVMNASVLFEIAKNARYSLFQSGLELEDRLIVFYLSLPNVFPYAQPWVHDDAEGRKQINIDRVKFNTFVNAKHNEIVASKGLNVETVSVETRDHSKINLHIYNSQLYTTYAQKAGAEELPLRPLFIWIHGGGFVYGEGRDTTLVDGMPQCNISTKSGSRLNDALVISIEHRLAPEHKFPVPTDDTVDGFMWIYQNADLLKIDLSRISIGGTSAGANLAAVLVQRLIYEHGIKVHFQLLMVPVIHYGCVTQSCLEYPNNPLLGAQEVVWFHRMYARSHMDGSRPHYNPLKLGDRCLTRKNGTRLSFPTSTVITAQNDALRDDGFDYKNYLEHCAHGNTVTHIELTGSHWSVYQNADLYRSAIEAHMCA
jgi:acetyl esterase/lipase